MEFALTFAVNEKNVTNKILTNKEIEKLSNMAQKYKEILNGSTT